MYAKSTKPSATIELRALGALKLAIEASYAHVQNMPAKQADLLF